MKRIGLIGMGFIGSSVYQRITQPPGMGLEVAFIWNRSAAKLGDYPTQLILRDLTEAGDREVELIVEMSHPSVTHDHGVSFLEHSDYLAASLTARADTTPIRSTARPSSTTDRFVASRRCIHAT